LLLKRFKNRLKAFDDVVMRINEKKANRTDLDELKASVEPSRAQVIFSDMKLLFDTTMAQNEKFWLSKVRQVEETYDRIMKKQ